MTSRHSLNRRQRRYKGREIRKARRLADQKWQSPNEFMKAWNTLVEELTPLFEAVGAGFTAFGQAFNASLGRGRKGNYVMIGESPPESSPTSAAQDATVDERTTLPGGADPSAVEKTPQIGAERSGFSLENVPVWFDEPAAWCAGEDQ